MLRPTTILACLLTLVAGAAAAQTGRDRALIAAAGAGDADSVRRLLGEGASVHAADERGVTALIAAAYRNHVEVAPMCTAPTATTAPVSSAPPTAATWRSSAGC